MEYIDVVVVRQGGMGQEMIMITQIKFIKLIAFACDFFYNKIVRESFALQVESRIDLFNAQVKEA
jgi:hypothetical protein